MTEAIVAGFFVWLEKLVAALVDRILADMKDEKARDELRKKIDAARSARTRQEKQDAAKKITESF